MKTPTALVIICSLIIVNSPAVAESGHPTGALRGDARIDALKERKDLAEATITVLNKKLDCEGDGDCDVLEMGTRLCGGPSKYLIVSANNTSLKTLKQKIEEYSKAEKELNLTGASGDCAPSPVLPQARCVKNVCVDGKK